MWIALVACNLLALLMLLAGLRERRTAALVRLSARAKGCAVGAVVVSAVFVLLGAVRLLEALRGESGAASEKAALMATGISEAMNCFAFALLLAPLPLVSAFVIGLRARRALRDGAQVAAQLAEGASAPRNGPA